MPVICIGPVCVPLHLLLAFLVAFAHRHGYLTFIKAEWVTWRFWRRKAVEAWRGHSAALGAPAEQPAPGKGEEGSAVPPGPLEGRSAPAPAAGAKEAGAGGGNRDAVLSAALQEAAEAERKQEGEGESKKRT